MPMVPPFLNRLTGSLLRKMPTHFLPFTRADVLDTWSNRSVPRALSDPFAGQLAAGLPPAPALFGRSLRFDLRFSGLLMKLKIL